MGPPAETVGLSPPLSLNSSSYRKDSKTASLNLRTLYRTSAQDGQMTESESHQPTTAILPTSPHLPPTPPGASNGEIRTAEDVVSDGTAFRSALVTPSNPNSPPTPDNTPPRHRKISFVRPFLETQPSLTSTRAESFTTAREDIGSEDEAGDTSQYQGNLAWSHSSLHQPSQPTHKLRHSSLPLSPLLYTEKQIPDDEVCVPTEIPSGSGHKDTHFWQNGDNDGHRLHASPQPLSTSTTPVELKKGRAMPRKNVFLPLEESHDVKSATDNTSEVHPDGLKRGKSLRDRLLDAQHQDLSASTEKFASIIGWNDSVPIEILPTTTQNDVRDDDRRLSGVSTTSTIEAYVFEPIALPKRKITLRHVNKHESLRSVSSPLPASNRNSMHSTSDSPHRLVHKKARLSNQNRWSFGSEISRSHSLASSAVLPKTEIIRVAVIPERSSSLPASSSSGSKRQSLSTGSARSQSRKVSEKPPSAWQHRRTVSETTDRGRPQTEPAPVIPPRSSSLSAPTSRSTSRANSITSENLRVRRQQAEKDLRKTLDRMESDRLLTNVRDWALEDDEGASHAKETSQVDNNSDQATVRTPSHPRALVISSTYDSELANNALGLFVPGTLEWAALRPTSTLETPFSQPSFRSTSPEINEARVINFFPHNNHSLQLIEPFSVAESGAVREVQLQHLPHIEVDSPLRNPRRPPQPPSVKVIPPTPGDESEKRLGIDGTSPGRATSLRRPGTHRRSESLMSSISRGLSLKNARNKKADQDLDGQFNPFWRPRAFWDDVDSHRPEEQPQSRQIGVVNNSLGLPQERTVVTGPVSLVRRISERRRQRRGVVKQTSHGSLARIRATRQFCSSPGLSLRFHLVGIKNIQERILRARQRKEDDRREKRRADLRRSIGPNVVMQGDSRFPASNTSLSRDT
ncbi:hypothetical protein H2204_001084 [Knufia peltigerae]|uniref:Uncharacterized protein n=1 Tax=Knufia peltigerae TaxID=1002370 RepID=A0AA38YDL5_9EURO|nr:hypothetical protein H2204_001084 [Knufia peltigerae]